MAEDNRQQIVQRKKKEQDLERTRRFRRKLSWTVIVFGLGVILTQLPQWVKTIRPEHRPIRVGATATDRNTDRCLENLWLISKDMQSGKSPRENLVCPACGRPYVFGAVDGKSAAWCPCPEAHGLSGLAVGGPSPVPQVIP